MIFVKALHKCSTGVSYAP